MPSHPSGADSSRIPRELPAPYRPPPEYAKPTPTSVSVQVGDATRKVLGFYQQIPILSAPGDLIRAKNGVQLIVAFIQADPSSPAGYIWLADAVTRARADGLKLAVVRAVLDPIGIVEYAAIRVGSQLGLEESIPQSVRRKAFALAVARLRSDPSESSSLYYASRVYLSQGHPHQALRFALMAARTSGSEPLPHVVSGLAFAQLGRYAEAETVGLMLLNRGSSLGLLPIAECISTGFLSPRVSPLLSGPSPWASPGGWVGPGPGKKLAKELSRRVVKLDAERFFGPLPSGGALVKQALESQRQKVNNARRILQ